MTKICVVGLIGNPCLLASEKGDQLANELKRVLQARQFVEVDFSGYEFLSSAFLNHAFGRVTVDLSLDTRTFNELIKIKGLDEDDMDEVQLAVANAQTRRTLLNNGVNPDEYYATHLPA
jgi:hypothetical protein